VLNATLCAMAPPHIKPQTNAIIIFFIFTPLTFQYIIQKQYLSSVRNGPQYQGGPGNRNYKKSQFVIQYGIGKGI
jgi:hypothetical protein